MCGLIVVLDRGCSVKYPRHRNSSPKVSTDFLVKQHEVHAHFLSFMGSSFFDKLFLAQKAQYLVHEPPHRGLLRTRKIDPASCFLSSFIRLVWTPHQGRICPTRTFPTSAPPCSLRSYRGAALAKWRQSTELHINSELASMVRFLLVV